jgi:hypothetical protein
MLRTVLRGRRVAITEMGWPSGERWNDDEIAGFVRDECKKWISFGAECYTHYSVEDGPKPNNHGEGGYGAHTNLADGFGMKPVAGVLTPLGGTT